LLEERSGRFEGDQFLKQGLEPSAQSHRSTSDTVVSFLAA
jgi:hypothetical protein